LRLVRIQKERKPSRGTHFLEKAEVTTGQDIERREGHSLPGEGSGQD